MLDIILTLISSTLTAFAMPGFFSEILIWFSLTFFLKSIRRKGILRSILLSYIYGLGLLAITCFWQLPTLAVEIPEILGRYGSIGGVIAFILAVTVLGAPPYMIFGFLMGIGNRMKLYERSTYPVFVASSYTLMEFIRGLGSFAFTGARLSDSLYRNIGLIQLSSLFGTLGLTFLIVLMNLIILSTWEKSSKISSALLRILSIIGTIYILSFSISASIPSIGYSKPVKILAFQMNLTQKIKYESNMEKQVKLVVRMMEDARKDFDSIPELYIFPEAVFFDDINFYPNLKRQFLEEVKDNGIPVVIGGIRRENGKNYNSALFVKGDEIDSYAKMKLTPFAEILPFPKFLRRFSFLRLLGYYEPGKEHKVFEINGSRFSVQICFESFFPEVSRNFTKNGAQFLVVITNDGWFKYSAALIQHFSKAVFRAVENGRYVIQVANTGITGVVDPHGRILKTFSEDEEKIGLFEVLPNDGITLYTRFGDSIVIISSLIIIVLSMIHSALRRWRNW